MAYHANSLDDLKVIADSFNCDLYVGDSYKLLLDLDNADAERAFRAMVPVLEEKFGATIVDHWRSRGGHEHVVVQLDVPMSPPERIALQAACGSDPVRSILAVWEFTVLNSDTISLFRPRSVA